VIENEPGVTYTWELYNDVAGINLATVPGNCPPDEAYFVGGVNTGDSVEVMCLVSGTYFIKVTAVNSCPTNNLKLGMIVVEDCYAYASFQEPPPVCEGDTAWLTLDITGTAGPWEVTYTDGTDVWTETNITASPYDFQLIPTPTVAGSYEYWVISVTDLTTGVTNTTPSEPVTLIVNPTPNTSPIYRYDPTAKK
jgi:hypothetical protein